MTSALPELQNWAGGTLKQIYLIGTNSIFAKTHKKGTGTKMAEKFERKKKSALFSTQRPLDDWSDALDHLAIDLVAN